MYAHAASAVNTRAVQNGQNKAKCDSEYCYASCIALEELVDPACCTLQSSLLCVTKGKITSQQQDVQTC